VTWSTSAASVATVSQTGTVTAVGAGTATITATSEGKSGSSVLTVTLPPVATVTFGSPTASVVVGRTTTLSPILKDAAGNVLTGRVVTWASNNGNVTVSSAGVATGVTIGSSTVTATSEGKSGTIGVTVTPVPVGTVTVAPATASVVATQTTTLTATVKDENGTVVTNRPITWGTSSASTATVSSSGVVTGIAAGTATITATAEGKSGSSTVTVAAIPVGSVTLSPASFALFISQTATPTLTVKDANGTVVTDRVVTWSTSAASVATVSAGVITAVGAGSATITAASEGKSATTSVTVTIAPVNSVAIAPTTASVPIGQTTTLAATVKDANGAVLTDRPVTWNSLSTGIATVSQSGVVTGVSFGTATITASAEGKTGTASVTVTPVPVATVTVAPPTVSISTIQTATLTATMKDAAGNTLNGRAVSWTSSSPLVASVSQSGVVTGLVPGTTTITATSEGKTGTSSVTVTLAPVSTVTVTPSPSSAFIGATTQLSATTKDVSGNVLTGRTISWDTSNSAVATVSQTGLVTGVAAGSATITATSETKSGASTVTVTQAPVATVTIAPTAPSVAEDATITLTATLKDANGNVLTGRAITWSSGNNTTATVSQAGVVTGKKKGSVTITATSEGKSGGVTVTVTQ